MRMIFKNADFSKTGIIESISPKLVQCTMDVLKGTITIGSTESYNRTASENLFKMNRTIVKNTGSTWISDDGIKFYIQNDTDKNITIRSENVTVNDFTMDMASFHANVENHKKANAIMELFSSELEENGITDINKIDFTIRCYEEDTYDDIWETDTITITME